MKLIAVFVILLNVMPDCSGDGYDRTYLFVNGTGVSITMDGYKYGRLRNSIFLAPMDSYEGISKGSPHYTGDFTPMDALYSDSVVVLFGNSKRQIYTWSGPENRNILDEEHFTRISKKLYRFTFNSEDIEVAEDVELIQ